MKGEIMKKRLFKIVSLLSIFVLLISGCGQAEDEKTAADDKSTGTAFTVTDLAGVEHSFDKPLDRVIVQWSGAGGPFMTMSALLGEDIADHLAGIDNTLQDYKADMWEQITKSVPKLADVPMIGSVDEKFDLDTVLASDAQAMILPLELKETVETSVGPKLKEAGIPVVYIDYHQGTVENHRKSTLLLGRLFDKEEKAQELVEFYIAHRNDVEYRATELLKTVESPSLYIEVGVNGPSKLGDSYDNTYFWGDIAHKAGASNVGNGIVDKTGPMDLDYIAAIDPDKIVFTGSYWPEYPESVRMGLDADEETAKQLIAAYGERPGWDELSAFKNGHVYGIYHGLAREMYDCAAYEFFAKICFPDEFSDLDPNKTLKEYFDEFLPYDFDGLWFLY